MNANESILNARLLADLSPAERYRFFRWIDSLTPEVDNEVGAGPGGFADWLREHAMIDGDVTFVYFRADEIVGTASSVSCDREVIAEEGGVVLAGVNVVREHRGRGVGTAIVAHVLAYVANRATSEARAIAISLKANDPVAIRLYAKLGFRMYANAPDTFWLVVEP